MKETDLIKRCNDNNLKVFFEMFKKFIKDKNKKKVLFTPGPASLSEENIKNLLFLDPPYYLENRSTLYGNNGDMHDTFDHDKLYECLKKNKNWFMTYNNCEYIKDLYKDFKIIETSWSYGMNKSKKSSEIVIIG